MGEITKHDSFGSAIIETIKKYNLTNNLEIGSWDGTGSTQCFIEGMKDFSEKRLVCLEVYEYKFEQLIQNTKQYDWVKCHNQSSISYDSLYYKDFDDIWNSEHNGIPKTDQNGDRKGLVHQWFVDDLTNILRFKTGYLEDYPNEQYDGVLIDGSEFTGYTEYLKLKDRTKVFFLDDYYNAFKTRQVAFELEKSGDWEVIGGSKHTRNGFAILKRK